jgi:hypothetical protein
MNEAHYKLRIAEAVKEAFSGITPKESPSGAHAIYVIGQLTVNVHVPTLPPPTEFEGPRQKRSTR